MPFAVSSNKKKPVQREAR